MASLHARAIAFYKANGVEPTYPQVVALERLLAQVHEEAVEWLRWWSDPAQPCADCGHKVGDHHRICGCQHMEPRYVDGWLKQHDKCGCRSHVDVQACYGALGE